MIDYRVDVGGVLVLPMTMRKLVDLWTTAALEGRQGRSGAGAPIRFVNVHTIVTAASDSRYSRILNGHGVNVADGWPVAAVVRRATGGSAVQIRGPEFFLRCLSDGLAWGARHALIGGTEDGLRELVANLERRYPGLTIVLSYSPPVQAADEFDVVSLAQEVVEAEADCVWLGLGSPKQDIVGDGLASAAGVPVVGVGAAFDFFSGRMNEAPSIVRRARLEWAYRLFREPRRLWRRYLVGGAKYAAIRARARYVRPVKRCAEEN